MLTGVEGARGGVVRWPVAAYMYAVGGDDSRLRLSAMQLLRSQLSALITEHRQSRFLVAVQAFTTSKPTEIVYKFLT